MNPQRIIFHCDCNNFFASCECLTRPELKNVPMAVAGDVKDRAGIVLAKNEIAKSFGVKTTDTVWMAQKKCPGIIFVPPRHEYYQQISQQVNDIYHQYTEYLEPASIDESYLDMTDAPPYYKKTPLQLADELRARIRNELGLTISVGISFNKVFAKLGSDYKKPDATTEITPQNYRSILWPLPITDMLFVGKAVAEALRRSRIFTIGELAARKPEELTALLGKHGNTLWLYANGIDEEPVRRFGCAADSRSISRGMTFRRDLLCIEDVRAGLSALTDEIAFALRRQHLRAGVIQVHIKATSLHSISRQATLKHSTCLQHEILDTAIELVKTHWNVGSSSPIRALTVTAAHLIHEDELAEQISMFDIGLVPDAEKTLQSRQRQEQLEAAVDKLRQKHGKNAITLGLQNNEDLGIHRSKPVE